MFDRHTLELAMERYRVPNRKKPGISGKELAEKVGISEVTMSRIRRGNIKNPGESIRMKLEKSLGLEPGTLVTPGDAPAEKPVILSPDRRELMAAYDAADDMGRIAIRSYALGISQKHPRNEG